MIPPPAFGQEGQLFVPQNNLPSAGKQVVG